jgi:uncharacterized membrane protein
MATRDGYIERIDFDRLAEVAESHETTVRIERAIGEFVIEGAPLVSVLDDTTGRDTLEQSVSATIDIGRHRTVDQDVGFGLRQLVDIALRALSPGINDTTTAIMCIEYLTAILSRLSTRPIGGAQQRPGRVINAHSPTFEMLLSDSFDQVREAGRGNFAVLQRLLGAVDAIAAMPISAARRQSLLEHVDLLDETAANSIESSRDRDRLRSMAERTRSRVILH